MNHYEALKALALKAVISPDGDAHWRSICRWYSRTFHTPLHCVDDLPEDDILTAYYESHFEDAEDQDRQDAIAEILQTPEQLKAKARRRDIEDAEALEYSRQLAEEERQKEAETKLKNVKVQEKTSGLKPGKEAESSMPRANVAAVMEKLEPDVAIKFVDAETFEAQIAGYGNMKPGKP